MNQAMNSGGLNLSQANLSQRQAEVNAVTGGMIEVNTEKPVKTVADMMAAVPDEDEEAPEESEETTEEGDTKPEVPAAEAAGKRLLLGKEEIYQALSQYCAAIYQAPTENVKVRFEAMIDARGQFQGMQIYYKQA